MAVLSRAEARRARAGAHARHVHTCSLCGRKLRGNGGWASHRRMHLRQAGVPADGLGEGGLREAFRELNRKGLSSLAQATLRLRSAQALLVEAIDRVQSDPNGSLEALEHEVNRVRVAATSWFETLNVARSRRAQELLDEMIRRTRSSA